MDAYGHNLLGHGRYGHYGHQEEESPRTNSQINFYFLMDPYGQNLFGNGRYRHYGHQEKETPRKISCSTFISLCTLMDTIY